MPRGFLYLRNEAGKRPTPLNHRLPRKGHFPPVAPSEAIRYTEKKGEWGGAFVVFAACFWCVV